MWRSYGLTPRHARPPADQSGRSLNLIPFFTPFLIALLVPAVQKVREASNRASWLNNLKQVALAALNYESSSRGFPYNAITKNNNNIGIPDPFQFRHNG
jgi:hypothetical protein